MKYTTLPSDKFNWVPQVSLDGHWNKEKYPDTKGNISFALHWLIKNYFPRVAFVYWFSWEDLFTSVYIKVFRFVFYWIIGTHKMYRLFMVSWLEGAESVKGVWNISFPKEKGRQKQ